jgi:hypothetical protein
MFILFMLAHLKQLLIFPLAEMARCFGKSVTPKALMHVFSRGIKPNVKLILEALEAGDDPEKVELVGVSSTGAGQGQTSSTSVTLHLHISLLFLIALAAPIPSTY